MLRHGKGESELAKLAGRLVEEFIAEELERVRSIES
jgi:hypothetical protein